MGQRPAAETACREAVDLLQKAVNQQSEVTFYLNLLARCRNQLAYYLQQSGQTQESEATRHQAYRDMRRVVAAYPETVGYRSSLASTALRYARQIKSPQRS